MKLNNFILSSVTASLFCFSNLSFGTSFSGFYFGAELGGSSTIATQDHIVDALMFDSDDQLVILEHSLTGPHSLKTGNSYKAALYAGWGFCINRTYLGGEIFLDWANYKNHEELDEHANLPNLGLFFNENINTKTRLSKVQFGADFRPGYIITPHIMLYGRVGGAFAQRTVGIEDIVNLRNGSTNIIFNLSTENEEHRIALRLGGGLETQICPKFNIRVDYIYTYYGHVSASAFDFASALIGGEEPVDFSANNSVATRIYNNAVMLGLTYLIN